MTEIFAMNLIGKTVVGTQGTRLGKISDITIHPRAGTLLNLLINPHDGVDEETLNLIPTEDGFFQLSHERVRAVQDTVVVEL